MKLKFSFILFSLLCINSLCLYSQFIPKRDVSKDHGVVNAKKQATSQTTKKQTTRVKNKKRLRTQQQETPKLATFLTVFSDNYFYDNFDCKKRSRYYEIRTDGQKVEVTNLPTWAHLESVSNSQTTIIYDANEEHFEREHAITLTSDAQTAYIRVLQAPKPINIKIDLITLSLIHNEVHDTPCLSIKVNYSLAGAKGLDCYLRAFFTDDKGNTIQANKNYPLYTLTNYTTAFTQSCVVPSTDYIQTYTTYLTIPNDALMLNKRRNKITCNVSFLCPQN